MEKVLFKSLVLVLSIFSVLQFSVVAFAAAPVSLDKWKPGHYMKIPIEQLINPSSSERIYAELANTPALRGVKLTLLWGKYEKKSMVKLFMILVN